MSKWREYFKRRGDKTMITIGSPVLPSLAGTVTMTTTTGTTIVPATPWISSPGMITTAAIAAPVSGISTYVGGVGGGGGVGITGAAPHMSTLGGGFGGITFAPPPPPTSIVTISNNSKEIVSIKPDGSVVWAHGIDIDAAAEAFSKSISLGVELAAGLTKSTKLRMRDSVFEDLISIAKEKGSLTAEDLTYLLQASKIVEKLKGGKE